MAGGAATVLLIDGLIKAKHATKRHKDKQDFVGLEALKEVTQLRWPP
jgi:hypothetical protein